MSGKGQTTTETEVAADVLGPDGLLPAPWVMHERYELHGRIGEGGMGIVYEAFDRERGTMVALKTIRRAAIQDVQRLKREFRVLADLWHPNLVCLYQLVVDETSCFFTMERVDGTNFAGYVAGEGSRSHTRETRAARARHALSQLVDGVDALHAQGVVHRDIKPANVLVTRDGRVVILDFGLAGSMATHSTGVPNIAGTRRYMAPERLAGDPPTPAADWYAVGATLRDALGPLGAAAPADLTDIRDGLLSPDVTVRWSARNAIERLRARLVHASRYHAHRPEHGEFTGRQAERAELRVAFDAARAGRCQIVVVEGPSGIGKSALLRQLMIELTDRATVLHGRCYEQEAVPYNAFDEAVDDLAAILRTRSVFASGVEADDVRASAQLFPSLRATTDRWNAATNAGGDLRDVRQRAFQALIRVLRSVAARRPVVLVLDDVHWADADSVALLKEIEARVTDVALLIVLAFRREEMLHKPWLRALAGTTLGAHRTISLRGLPRDDATEAALRILQSGAVVSDAGALSEHIADMADGNPYLLEQLARSTVEQGGNELPTMSAEELLARRFARLTADARRYLEVLAICSRPMPVSMVSQALEQADVERVVAVLRAWRLARRARSFDEVEPYHDRIRSAALRNLASDARRELHQRVLAILEASPAPDPETLLEHARGAGHATSAAMYAAQAGQQALDALAFDRAASFFMEAVAEPSVRTPERCTLLGDALSHAGRPVEAAQAYLQAAVDGPRRLELQRRAAEQFLLGGRIDRGYEVIGHVLRSLGMRAATSTKHALLSVLWHRARLFVTPERRSDTRSDPMSTLRVDVCWSMAIGLIMLDAVRAADFQARHLVAALGAGDPWRLARALTLDPGIFSAGGDVVPQAMTASRTASSNPTGRGSDTYLDALTSITLAMRAVGLGEWVEVTRHCEDASQLLARVPAGCAWERTALLILELGGRLFQGQFRTVSERLPAHLADADARGNLVLATELRTRMNLAWLVTDDVEEGARQARAAFEKWAQPGFQRQQYNFLLARVQTALYLGDGARAWSIIDEAWPRVRSSFVRLNPHVRIESSYLRARSAMLAVTTGGAGSRARRVARRETRRLLSSRNQWARTVGLLMKAVIAADEGWQDQATTHLTDVLPAFEAHGALLYAAVVRDRLGARLGGPRGEGMRRQAQAWMASEGIRRPDRIGTLVAPGL